MNSIPSRGQRKNIKNFEEWAVAKAAAHFSLYAAAKARRKRCRDPPRDPLAQVIFGQEKTASKGETAEEFSFDAEDRDNSWKPRTYNQDEKTFVQSGDRQRMYEVPDQDKVSYSVNDDGTIVLNDDIVSLLDKRDYRDFIKAYAAINLVDPANGMELDPKSIIIKADGARVIITQTGINDVVKKFAELALRAKTMYPACCF